MILILGSVVRLLGTLAKRLEGDGHGPGSTLFVLSESEIVMRPTCGRSAGAIDACTCAKSVSQGYHLRLPRLAELSIHLSRVDERW